MRIETFVRYYLVVLVFAAGVLGLGIAVVIHGLV